MPAKTPSRTAAKPKVQPTSPYLTVKGAADAIALYQKAFGAKVRGRMAAQDGTRIMHADLAINGGTVMLCDEFPEHGGPAAPSRDEPVAGGCDPPVCQAGRGRCRLPPRRRCGLQGHHGAAGHVLGGALRHARRPVRPPLDAKRTAAAEEEACTEEEGGGEEKEVGSLTRAAPSELLARSKSGHAVSRPRSLTRGAAWLRTGERQRRSQWGRRRSRRADLFAAAATVRLAEHHQQRCQAFGIPPGGTPRYPCERPRSSRRTPARARPWRTGHGCGPAAPWPPHARASAPLSSRHFLRISLRSVLLVRLSSSFRRSRSLFVKGSQRNQRGSRSLGLAETTNSRSLNTLPIDSSQARGGPPQPASPPPCCRRCRHYRGSGSRGRTHVGDG